MQLDEEPEHDPREALLEDDEDGFSEDELWSWLSKDEPDLEWGGYVDLEAIGLPELPGEFKRLSVLAGSKPPRDLVQGAIAFGDLVVLYGASGTGKSFVALDLAFRVALGMPWFGRNTQRVTPVYIVAEDAAGTGVRARGWHHRYFGETRLALINDPIVLDVPVNLFTGINGKCPSKRSALWLQSELGELVQHLESIGAPPFGLLVVDTLSRCMTGGSEVSDRDIGTVIDALDAIRKRFKCTVVVVHHVSKEELKDMERPDPERAMPRGSTKILNDFDVAFYTTRRGSDAEKKATIYCNKQKGRDKCEPLEVKLEHVAVDGVPDGTMVVVEDMDPPDDSVVFKKFGVWGQPLFEVLSETELKRYRDLKGRPGTGSPAAFTRRLDKMVSEHLAVRHGRMVGYTKPYGVLVWKAGEPEPVGVMPLPDTLDEAYAMLQTAFKQAPKLGR